MKDGLFNYLVTTDTLDEFLGKKPRIISNKVKSINCGKIIESKTINDFKRCMCGKIAIDGGIEYLKRIGNDEVSEIEE